MILLGIIVIVLALTPVWIIWTPRVKVLRVKICLTVLSAAISIMMMSACMQLSDVTDMRDNMMRRNQDYVNCVKRTNNADIIANCIKDNMDELNEIYGD